jgi:hypothetical protein
MEMILFTCSIVIRLVLMDTEQYLHHQWTSQLKSQTHLFSGKYALKFLDFVIDYFSNFPELFQNNLIEKKMFLICIYRLIQVKLKQMFEWQINLLEIVQFLKSDQIQNFLQLIFLFSLFLLWWGILGKNTRIMEQSDNWIKSNPTYTTTIKKSASVANTKDIQSSSTSSVQLSASKTPGAKVNYLRIIIYIYHIPLPLLFITYDY